LRSLLIQRERSKDKGETAIAYFTPNSHPKIPIVVIVHRAKIYLWESELSSAPFHSLALDHHHHAGLLTSISILGSPQADNEIFYITIGKFLYCLTYCQRVLIVTGKHELGDVIKSIGVVAQNNDPSKVFLCVGYCSSRVILFKYDASSSHLKDPPVLLSRIDHCNVTDISCLKSIHSAQLILVTSEKASNIAHVWIWSLPQALSSALIISPPLPIKLDQGLAVTCVDICLHPNNQCCYVLTTGINRMKLWLLHLTEDPPHEEFMVSWMPNRKGIQGAKFLQVVTQSQQESQQTILIGLASRDRSFQVLNIVNGQVVKSLTDLGHLTQLAVLTNSPAGQLPHSPSSPASASSSINVAIITVGSSISAHSINLGATEILCPNLFAGQQSHSPLFIKTTITAPLAIRSSSQSSQTRFAIDNGHFCLNPSTCSISSQCTYCATCCQQPTAPDSCRKCLHSSMVVYQFIVAYSSNEYDPREIFFYPLSPLQTRPVWSGYLVANNNSSYQFQLRASASSEPSQIHLRVQFVFSFALCSISYLAVSFEEEVRSSKRTKILFVQMTETGPGDVTILCNPSSSNHYSCPESIHKLSVFNHLNDVVIISTINELNGTLTCFLCDSELMTTEVIEIRDSHRLLNDVHLAAVNESLPLMISCGNDNLIRVYENYCPAVSSEDPVVEKERIHARPKILQGHRDDVTCLTSLLSDGNKYPYIISGSSDTSIR
jgi:hypothetical protein